jgi:competence protein ComEC
VVRADVGIGPFSNAFAIPWVSSVVTPLVLAGVALPAPLDAYAFRLAHAALGPMMTLLRHLADWPAGVFWLRIPDWPVLALACMGAAWALMPRGWPLRWAAPITWLPLVAPAPDAPPPGGFRLTVLDVGQGESVLVETARRTLLFDAGPGPSRPMPARGSSCRHCAHAASASSIRSSSVMGTPIMRAARRPSMPARRFASCSPASCRNTGCGAMRRRPASPIAPCAAGQRWTWDGVVFTMLWPSSIASGRSNEQSCVLRIDAAGTSALLTGDLDARAERRLVAGSRDALAAQILVVPHHGSRIVGRAFPRFGRAARRGISCRLSQSLRASAPLGPCPLRGARNPAAAHRSRRRRAVRRRAVERGFHVRTVSRGAATLLDGSVSAAPKRRAKTGRIGCASADGAARAR